MSNKKFKRVFLALDTNNISAAEKLIKLLKNNLAGIKIGKELFSVYGPEIIKKFSLGTPKEGNNFCTCERIA